MSKPVVPKAIASPAANHSILAGTARTPPSQATFAVILRKAGQPRMDTDGHRDGAYKEAQWFNQRVNK
jgi:hypothetical protein